MTIRAVDVCIGDFYCVRDGSGEIVVRIDERMEICCWRTVNTVSGKDRYVLLADLVAKVDGPREAVAAAAPETPRQRTSFESLNERLRRATGSSDDDG